MVALSSDLWTLVLERPHIDPTDLAIAIEHQIDSGDLDFRTRLLIRDAMRALLQVWGQDRLDEWIAKAPAGKRVKRIVGEDLGSTGFPFLAGQLMETTKSETIRQFLRELGLRTPRSAHIAIGGSAALILRNQLSRHTLDIDVVDEIPAVIRSEHELVQKLAERYRLQLTHFQSHYLPARWESRLTSFDRFGQLDVSLVDTYDIALSKLLSHREKDRDDLRVLIGQIDKKTFESRLAADCKSHLGEPKLRQDATQNWYILYGEALPA